MRKYVLLLIVATSLILTGCQKEPKVESALNNKKELKPSALDNVQLLDDIYLTLDKPVYTSSDTVIKYQIHNDSADEQSYSPEYYLEYLYKGNWYNVPSKDNDDRFFIKIAHMLPAGTTTDILEIDFDESTPLIKGDYRLIKNIGGTNIYKQFKYQP